MNLHDYFRLLGRNWLIVASLAILGLLLAAVAGFSMPATYEAKTRLFVATQGSGSVAELQQGNSFTQARVQSYAETATTPLVLQPVIDSLGLDLSPVELARFVSASSNPDTVLLDITARDRSAVQAAAIAQSVSDSLVSSVETLERGNDGADSTVRVTVITPATAPTTPSSPNVPIYLLAGLLAGLLLGMGAAILRSTLDTRVRGEENLRTISSAPMLGGVVFDPEAVRRPLITQIPGQSQRAESFRQIRTNLQFAHVSHKSKAVLITSSLSGEGKSTTAVNLAIAIAQGGQSVVLVDADLRRPRVDEYLGLERNAGLTTALIGRAEVEDLLQPWGSDELYVLTAGQIPPNPSELLGSSAMKQLITRLEEKFDAVIIDAPPLLPVTDAAVLAQQVGGVVLVIGSSKVKLPDLQKSLGNLKLVDADLLGVVMNFLPTKGQDASSYSYYSYVPHPGSHSTVEDEPAAPVSRRGSRGSFEKVPGSTPEPTRRSAQS